MAGNWGQKTWLITGASTGFGQAMAQAVLAHGGRIIATARNRDSLAALAAQAPDRVLALKLDVTSPADIAAAITAAEAFGGIDVLANNAGYGFLGGIEESADDEIAAQLDVNLHGALRMIRTVLPGMRARGSGYILNISSIAGLTSFPGAGFYSATKFALEAISEALRGEVDRFGVRVMVIEPGYFRTDFSGRSLMTARQGMPDYAFLAERRAAARANDGQQPGDPVRGSEAIITAMNADAPPFRLALGSDACGFSRKVLEGRMKELDAWQVLSCSTDFPA